MKTVGIIGKGSGKLGSTVFAVSGGEQIARVYTDKVSNPSTNAQVQQRARMKLASQLAAAMNNVIVIPKKGLQSSRNLFVKKNMLFIQATVGGAVVSYEKLQLTSGNAALPGVFLTRTEGEGVDVFLLGRVGSSVNRVVYVLFKKTTENQLQYITSAVETNPGTDGDFTHTFDYIDGELVVYAYGMRDNNAKAAAKYGNYQVATGEDIAQLVANRQISASDYSFTATSGNTLPSGEDEPLDPEEGKVIIGVSAGEGGTVSATGLANGKMKVAIGSSVTVTATPNTAGGYSFHSWMDLDNGYTLSTAAEYTFTAAENINLIAIFQTSHQSDQD